MAAWRSTFVALVCSLVPALADAFPVVGLPAPITRQYLASEYRVGYVDAGNREYRFYREQQGAGWGAWQELRLDQNASLRQAALVPRIAAGQVQINEWGPLGGATYAGNGNNLAERQVRFGWDQGYNIGFDGSTVEVDVQIQFDWARSGLDAATQARQQADWERGIEGWWNHQFHISKDGGLFTFGIQFDVTFDGYNDGVGRARGGAFDFVVEVLPANPAERSDVFNWHVGDTAQTASHEFGHMLGLYDEYWAGGVDSTTLLTDYNALMGATSVLPAGTGMKQSFYEPFVRWLRDQDPDPANVFVLVSEPGMAWLLGLSGFVLVVVRRASRARGA